MSLQRLLSEGRLRPHQTSVREIVELCEVADRDLADAAVLQLSTDRRFATAYNAALALATMALHAGGYRAVGIGHHWATFQALSEIMGPQQQARQDYFDHCRGRRNTADYDRAGVTTESQAQELLAEATAFREEVLEWLRVEHPELAPDSETQHDH
jgi:uncharacterized protein (UPF0332 family)